MELFEIFEYMKFIRNLYGMILLKFDDLHFLEMIDDLKLFDSIDDLKLFDSIEPSGFFAFRI